MEPFLWGSIFLDPLGGGGTYSSWAAKDVVSLEMEVLNSELRCWEPGTEQQPGSLVTSKGVII